MQFFNGPYIHTGATFSPDFQRKFSQSYRKSEILDFILSSFIHHSWIFQDFSHFQKDFSVFQKKGSERYRKELRKPTIAGPGIQLQFYFLNHDTKMNSFFTKKLAIDFVVINNVSKILLCVLRSLFSLREPSQKMYVAHTVRRGRIFRKSFTLSFSGNDVHTFLHSETKYFC